MEHDEVLLLLTALVKQMGGEVFITEETLSNTDGGLALFVDEERNRIQLKWVSQTEAMFMNGELN